MKILVLTPCYLPVIGGAETGLFELYRRLADRHEVHVVTRRVKAEEGSEGDLDPYYQCDRIRVIRYSQLEPASWGRGFRGLPGIPMFAATAALHAAAFRPDMIHAHFIATCTSALSALRYTSRAPAVISLVGRADILDEANPYYARKPRQIDAALGRAARIIHLTDYMLGGHARDARYVKIPYGVNPAAASPAAVAAFRARLGLAAQATVLVSLSRFENRTKRQRLMVESLAPLLRNRPQTVLVLAGEGPDRVATAAWIKEQGLERQVLTPGFIPECDIPACLACGSIFVFASKLETFGIVLAQAMQAGLPIVAMDSSCLAEVVRHGECGLIVPDQDQVGFCSAVGRLLDDANLRTQMGATGRIRAQTEFDWDAIAGAHERIFTDVLSGLA